MIRMRKGKGWERKEECGRRGNRLRWEGEEENGRGMGGNRRREGRKREEEKRR
jgi:hypothetical protein